MKVVLKIKRQL